MSGPEIECLECDGDGKIWNNADPTSGQFVECGKCDGKGWREMTRTAIAKAVPPTLEGCHGN